MSFPKSRGRRSKIKRLRQKNGLCQDSHHQHARRIVFVAGSDLAREGVKLNVTGILTQEQVAGVAQALKSQGARRRVCVRRAHRRHGR